MSACDITDDQKDERSQSNEEGEFLSKTLWKSISNIYFRIKFSLNSLNSEFSLTDKLW
jgi:hypothetical protein